MLSFDLHRQNCVQDRAKSATRHNTQLFHNFSFHFQHFLISFFGIKKTFHPFHFSMRTELKRKFTIFSLWRAEKKLKNFIFSLFWLSFDVVCVVIHYNTLINVSRASMRIFTYKIIFTRDFNFSFIPSYFA